MLLAAAVFSPFVTHFIAFLHFQHLMLYYFRTQDMRDTYLLNVVRF